MKYKLIYAPNHIQLGNLVTEACNKREDNGWWEPYGDPIIVPSQPQPGEYPPECKFYQALLLWKDKEPRWAYPVELTGKTEEEAEYHE